MSTTLVPAIDMEKLNAFIGQFVTDLGAAVHTGMVVIGEKLGLYKALAGEALSSAQLAAKTKTDERYVREWLGSQAAAGYITYDATSGKFSLTAEQAFALATEDSPAYLPGAFELALGSLAAVPRITEAFRTGAGMGWHEHVDGVFHGCEKFFRPGYAANLVSSWIPALHDVRRKAGGGGACGRCRLRQGRFDHSDGKSSFPIPDSSGSITTTSRLQRRARRRCATVLPIASTLRLPTQRGFPAKSTTSWRSSIVCTTWETRSARLRTSGSHWRRMGPG